MPSIAIFLIYLTLTVECVALTVLLLRKKVRNKLDVSMLFITTMLIGWLVCEILFLVSPDMAVARFFFDLKLPFVSLEALAWFFYVIRFYGRENYFPPVIVLCFLVVPLFTCFMAVTSPLHNHLRESIEIYQVMPTVEYSMERGPWFWYHLVYCYVLLFVGLVAAVIQHFRTPPSQKRPSTMLLFALTLSVLANLLTVVVDAYLDFSLIAASVSVAVLYYTTRKYQGLNFIIQTRNEAFHQIDKPMYILDSEDNIVVMNRSARDWMVQEGIKSTSSRFGDIVSQIEEKASSKEVLDESAAGVDYRSDSGRVLNVRYRPLLDNRSEEIGKCVFVVDETSNRELIDRLDKYSGMDALTGLSNRRQMEDDLITYSTEEYLPTGIIFGDLNGLKETNDTFGHQEGDTLLRIGAEVLKRTCPPSAKIARMGGDEYVMILPNYSFAQTLALTNEIRVGLQNEDKQHSFEVSMSLGFAVREYSEPSLREVLRTADENMYEDKKRKTTSR